MEQQPGPVKNADLWLSSIMTENEKRALYRKYRADQFHNLVFTNDIDKKAFSTAVTIANSIINVRSTIDEANKNDCKHVLHKLIIHIAFGVCTRAITRKVAKGDVVIVTNEQHPNYQEQGVVAAQLDATRTFVHFKDQLVILKYDDIQMVNEGTPQHLFTDLLSHLQVGQILSDLCNTGQ